MFAQVLLVGRKSWKVLSISFWVLEGILLLGAAIRLGCDSRDFTLQVALSDVLATVRCEYRPILCDFPSLLLNAAASGRVYPSAGHIS